MNAAVLHAFGEAPRFQQFPDPVPGDGEVLVRIRAAGLHPVVRWLASGQHYAGGGALPVVPGVDGAGVLADGTRVYVAGSRPPYGTMAELTVVPAARCIRLPDEVDDATAAAIANPGIAAWIALTWRGRLQPGETVLVLGATGTAGQLTVQLARSLGAGRVVVAGRNPAALERLRELGADAAVQLDQPDLAAAFAREVQPAGVDVVVDYVWGAPAEALIAALPQGSLVRAARPVRFVQVGSMAGPTITLPAASLRGFGLELTGTGIGTTPPEVYTSALPALMTRAARGELRVDVEPVALAEVGAAWAREPGGRRLVLVP